MKTVSKQMNVKKSVAIGMVAVIFSLCFGLFYYSTRYYLPELPFEGMSEKQVYEIVSNHSKSIIYLTNSEGYNWYIYQGNPKDGSEELIEQFNTLGLQFKEQMGSGYFFTKNNNEDEIVVQSQMWTSKYVVFQVPDEVRF